MKAQQEAAKEAARKSIERERAERAAAERRAQAQQLRQQMRQKETSGNYGNLSTTVSASTGGDTSSTAVESRMPSRNLRDRYRRVRQQLVDYVPMFTNLYRFPEVISRLERERMSTPAKLEWNAVISPAAGQVPLVPVQPAVQRPSDAAQMPPPPSAPEPRYRPKSAITTKGAPRQQQQHQHRRNTDGNNSVDFRSHRVSTICCSPWGILLSGAGGLVAR
jgi:hypothetical protein